VGELLQISIDGDSGKNLNGFKENLKKLRPGILENYPESSHFFEHPRKSLVKSTYPKFL